MVVNRPVIGVRNPILSTSTSSPSRVKNTRTGSPESGGKPHPRNPHLTLKTTSEPGPKLLEAATIPQNQKA